MINKLFDTYSYMTAKQEENKEGGGQGANYAFEGSVSSGVNRPPNQQAKDHGFIMVDAERMDPSRP
eukprot:CAMPEP_0170495818 /NCGR_PEP_ID=MMETSP0208-20121228/18760_1 /TAXON_ID=197538 /ORGANISM="Strombidium inclinatum, Strain S3" /LENGTH=65 /DNA_ID=CAMNT_0010772191 /DNA_START=749 /DNA_END=946 /DNA_ORIENTATION=+